METTIKIKVDTEELDAATEKVNRLVELLQEAQQKADSLFRSSKQPTSKYWRRFELLTESNSEKERLERVLDEHHLSRQDLAIILSGLRVRPEFGKEHFGI